MTNELYYDVDRAIDYAFEGQFVLKFYDYLKVCDIKRPQVEEFIHSSTAVEITDLVNELGLTRTRHAGDDGELTLGYCEQLINGGVAGTGPPAVPVCVYILDIVNVFGSPVHPRQGNWLGSVKNPARFFCA